MIAPPGSLRQTPSPETAEPPKQVSPHHRQVSKAHTGKRMHMAFKLPYIYDYTTTLCRQQAQVIQNHDNVIVRNIGQGEA
jgi:hypothetical protein